MNYKTIWGQKNHLKWAPIGGQKKIPWIYLSLGVEKKNHLKWSPIGREKKSH
jgi:hypothetical protein